MKEKGDRFLNMKQVKHKKTLKNILGQAKVMLATVGLTGSLVMSGCGCGEKRTEDIFAPSLEDLIDKENAKPLVENEKLIEEQQTNKEKKQQDLKEDIKSNNTIDLSNYTGYSLDEALESIGLKPTPELKAELAASLGIDPYLKTAEQNLLILQSLGATINVGGVEQQVIINENGEFIVVPVGEEKKKQEENEIASNKIETPERQDPEKLEDDVKPVIGGNDNNDSENQKPGNNEDKDKNDSENQKPGNNEDKDKNDSENQKPGNDDTKPNPEDHEHKYTEEVPGTRIAKANGDGTHNVYADMKCPEDGSIQKQVLIEKNVVCKPGTETFTEIVNGVEYEFEICVDGCGTKVNYRVKKPVHDHKYTEEVPGTRIVKANGDGTHNVYADMKCPEDGSIQKQVLIEKNVVCKPGTETFTEIVNGVEYEFEICVDGCGTKVNYRVKKPDHNHKYTEEVPGTRIAKANGDGTHNVYADMKCPEDGSIQKQVLIEKNVVCKPGTETFTEIVNGVEYEFEICVDGCGTKVNYRVKKPVHDHKYTEEVPGTRIVKANGDGTHNVYADMKCPEDGDIQKQVVIIESELCVSDGNIHTVTIGDEVWEQEFCPHCGYLISSKLVHKHDFVSQPIEGCIGSSKFSCGCGAEKDINVVPHVPGAEEITQIGDMLAYRIVCINCGWTIESGVRPIDTNDELEAKCEAIIQQYKDTEDSQTNTIESSDGNGDSIPTGEVIQIDDGQVNMEETSSGSEGGEPDAEDLEESATLSRILSRPRI